MARLNSRLTRWIAGQPRSAHRAVEVYRTDRPPAPDTAGRHSADLANWHSTTRWMRDQVARYTHRDGWQFRNDVTAGSDFIQTQHILVVTYPNERGKLVVTHAAVPPVVAATRDERLLHLFVTDVVLQIETYLARLTLRYDGQLVADPRRKVHP